ncbi:MAG TPA: hypothetical protein IAD10_09050 [Candidatus Fimicola cottocaccae]|nr:hypothetical protein [Candidatus Fimicola cottocaccae]
MENKHKAVLNWLANYPELQSFLYFNVTKEEIEFTSINTVSSDTVVEEYFQGALKNYDFALVMMKQYDTGTSDINVDGIFNVEKFMKWIDKQNKNKNFPFFQNAQVLSVKNLQNEPSFSGINEAGDIAKYMCQVRIEYYENE